MASLRQKHVVRKRPVPKHVVRKRPEKIPPQPTPKPKTPKRMEKIRKTPPQPTPKPKTPKKKLVLRKRPVQKLVLRKRPEKMPPIGQVKPLPYEPPAAHVEPWLRGRSWFSRPEPVPRKLMENIMKTLPQPTPKPKPKPKTPKIKDKVNLIDPVGNVQDVKSEPSTKPTIPISEIRTKITDFLKKWGALSLIIVLIGLFLGGRRK